MAQPFSGSNHPRSRLSVVGVSVSLSLALACYLAVLHLERRKKRSEADSSPATRPQQEWRSFCEQRLHSQENRTVNGAQTPSEQLKQLRWQRLIPKLIMKRPMYDNIRMLDPEGSLLCTISQKKANWYVRKDLAAWIDEKSKDSIQLLFEPKKKRNDKAESEVTLSKEVRLSEQYNQSFKQNRCVACGSVQQYMRHYVVPSCYRVHFPEAYKTHLPHDVVLLCPACQVLAQRATQRQQRQLERQCLQEEPNDPHNRRDTRSKYLVDLHLQHLQNVAVALTKWKDQLPPERLEEYRATLCQWFHVSDLTDEHLRQALKFECRALNPHYISAAQQVVQAELPSGLDEFVRDWRRLFLSTMRPQYLPPGWSVDSPVRCDLQ